MKKLLLAALVLSLSVAQVTRADNNERKKHKRQNDPAAEARPQQNAPGRQAVRQPVMQAPRSVLPIQRNISRTPRSLAPSQRQAVRREAQLEGRNGNVNRNSFTVARGNVIRTPHSRNWWHSHYNTTFVLFGGGYYYWWNNYWYPAYGYNPYYNNYLYSEPIYGYNELSPARVIENVQLALRDEGYYPGAIDGLIGPQTRAALGAYQRDHSLVITEAVDEPTLVTLGLA